MAETGGHAFPCNTYNGMTLRDYFAAQALPSVIALIYKAIELGATKLEGDENALKEAAIKAYIAADLMLEVRKL